MDSTSENATEGRDGPRAAGAAPHPWDDYLAGPENELAMAAARAMARGEHRGLTPLVVYGPSGVGKSRLLAGLVAERIRREPGAVVAHLDADSFAASYAEAAAAPADGDGWSSLRERLRAVELLVLEDLEGLLRAPSARDELAHTLDALDAAGAAVAVSARTAPATWPRREWPGRLISRLQGGLTARIDPPGPASRRRHVLNRAGAHGLTLQADAVEQLAAAADGYRTLDGWLARLALEARIGSRSAADRARAFDVQAVATILAEETILADPAESIDAIARSVAARFGVRLGVVRGPSRRAAIVEARHLAMHLARVHTGASFAAIGAYFGGRDPATVRHACRAAGARLSADPALAAVAAAIGPITRRTLLATVPALVAWRAIGAPSDGPGIGKSSAGLDALAAEVRALIKHSSPADVGVAYHDLANDDELLINADATFHAASTMKVPVLMELYRQADEKTLSLDDRIAVKIEFTSIVDGKPFALKVEDDSETTLYRRLGERMTIRELARLMITESSNVATNLLIERVTAAKTSALMERIGAKQVRVLRGVEDGRAYARGMNNTTTARGLMTILVRLARREVVSRQASEEMIAILRAQKFAEGIPAGLPAGVAVAHKTGAFTGIYHDAAIVEPPHGKPFVLVVLTRGIKEAPRAHKLVAGIARAVYAASRRDPSVAPAHH